MNTAKSSLAPSAPHWPTKQREVRNHHFDSSIWNRFEFRDDDICICTYGKSGTTWMQQIVGQLLFNGREDLEIAQMSPCLEHRVPAQDIKLAQVRNQEHRRFIKSHLPVDALVFSPKMKYIYIARDGRDVVWSWYNHHVNANDTWYQTINDTPGRVGHAMPRPRDSIREYFLEWLEKDGYPFWPYWSHIRSWWDIRALPNVRVIHFSDLKRDLEGSIRSIAKFIDVTVEQQQWPNIIDHCTFEYMKSNATRSLPFGGKFWDEGSKTFIHRGTNGRWRDVLTEQDIREYEATARRELGDACAHWLATGEGTPTSLP